MKLEKEKQPKEEPVCDWIRRTILIISNFIKSEMDLWSSFLGGVYFVGIIVALPVILAWTVLGLILTISPEVCSTVTLSVITILFLYSEFYYFSEYLLLEYFLFLPIIVFSFLYRMFTRKFKYITCIILFIAALAVSVIVDLTIANNATRVVSFLTLFAIANVSVVSLSLWVPATDTGLLKAQEVYVGMQCDRKVNHLMVAGLGTIKVLDEYVPEEDEEEEVNIVGLDRSSDEFINSYQNGGMGDGSGSGQRPVLVLVHGFGGCNGDWAGALSVLQQRYLLPNE
jgi:hypothetical protein